MALTALAEPDLRAQLASAPGLPASARLQALAARWWCQQVDEGAAQHVRPAGVLLPKEQDPVAWAREQLADATKKPVFSL